jgi:glycosyltransferase involved in cell wall biosynthesis
VLHPTFESWGGAEWFIHQVIAAGLGGSPPATIYTHRWTAPPGGEAACAVLEHRRGGILSAPWDWEKIAVEQAEAWRSHGALFIHNWPATQWYHEGCGRGALPPAVWFCHEPPPALYGADRGGKEAPAQELSGLLDSLRFYGKHVVWRVISRLRARRSVARMGEELWVADLRRRDRVAVASLPVVLANSRFTARRIREIYEREAEVVYPVPPDLRRFRPSGPSEKQREILWVGRLTHHKRPHVMLSAWRQATEVEPALADYRLVMVGDGPMRPAIEARIEKLGLGGSVTLLRNLPRSDLIERYRSAILTVHLGVAEPFGLVPLESMAAGTAVLAEGDGGARETILEEETGWTIDGIDEPTLADRLARVPGIEWRLKEMGRVATDHAREAFDPDAAMARLRQVLAEASRGG